MLTDSYSGWGPGVAVEALVVLVSNFSAKLFFRLMRCGRGTGAPGK